MSGTKPRVVVLGGGFGGLETAFSLRKAVGDAAAITLVSDLDHFYFKPNSIYVPFGLDPAKLRVPLARPARRKGIELIQDRVRGVDPDGRRVETDGRQLEYDQLVIATGAGMRAEEVPGLPEFAQGTWTAEDMLSLRESFAELVEASRAGERRRVLFLVPPNNKCAGPLYEIVLMLETWLRRHANGARPEITWTTYEPSFIHAFGPRLHGVVAEEFSAARNHGSHGLRRERGVRRRRSLRERREPRLRPPGLVPAVRRRRDLSEPPERRPRLYQDGARDEAGRRPPDIYAVGDSGDFPVKQAFLAFLQADAAAADIGARILGREPAHRFDPISMCVMEQFDKATFAQVPLQLTGTRPTRSSSARRGGRLRGRQLAHLAHGQEDARPLGALAVRAGRALPRWRLLGVDGPRPEGHGERIREVRRALRAARR